MKSRRSFRVSSWTGSNTADRRCATTLRSIESAGAHLVLGPRRGGASSRSSWLEASSSPSVTGVLQGLFGGFMIALMFAAAFGGLLLWARNDRTRGPASATSTRAAELDARLAPALRELNDAADRHHCAGQGAIGHAGAARHGGGRGRPGSSRVAAMILRVCSGSDCS